MAIPIKIVFNNRTERSPKMAYKDKQKQKDYMKSYRKKRYPYRNECVTFDDFINKRLEDKRVNCSSKGILFDLDFDYLKSSWTGYCPILGIPIVLDSNTHGGNKAELDRLHPNLGYTKGNVKWISGRANRLKSSFTKEELIKVLDYLTD